MIRMGVRNLGGAFALLALGALLAVTGYQLLFSTFMIYDDEGYVLLSLQNFSNHGGLYDRIFTQYGPFPYLLYDALHRLLGFEYGNTSGRWITLVNWLGTAIACGAIVGRTTRSLLLGAFSLVATFVYLWVMIHEPIHPGGLISCVIAMATWLGVEAWRSDRIQLFVLSVGVAAAVLIFTKINVGVFFLGASVTWLALSTASPAAARGLAWAAAIGAALLPLGLMQAFMDAPWARMFALIFTAGSIGTLLAGRAVALPAIRLQHWNRFAFAFIGTGLLISGVTLLRGTSVEGLISGILLDPLKHPGVYFFAVQWKDGSGLLALASVTFAAWSAWTGAWKTPRWIRVVAGLRLIVVLLCLCSPLGLIPTTFAAWGLSYGVSLAWLFVVPLQQDNRSASARAWVALVFVFQALHVYPVAGSQLNWGTYLWVPLMAMGLHDAQPVVCGWIPAARKWLPHVAAVGVAGVTLFMAGRLFRIGHAQYSTGLPLNLQGAEDLRLVNDLAYTLRIADENLRAHGDLLFSFPGLYSANLWTGLPTPSLNNATHWFSLLSAPAQQEIIDRLIATPRALVLVQRDLLDFLKKDGFSTGGPLHAWLMAHFAKSLAFGGYEIWVRKDRSIAGYSLAHTGKKLPGGIDQLTLTLQRPAAPIARFELCSIERPRDALVVFDGKNSSVLVTPCSPDGQARTATERATFPLTLEGPSTMTVQFSGINVSAKLEHLLLVARDPEGKVLGELLLIE